MDRLKPVYFGNGESYSDDEEAYDFPSPDPSEYDEDEDEDVPTEYATSDSDGSSSFSSEEDDDDDGSTSGSESEDEEDPAEADPIPRNRIVHVCRFLVDQTRCTSMGCINFNIKPTVSRRIHEEPIVGAPRAKRSLENPEETPIKRTTTE
jgi:hypothetical protein